MPFWFLFSEEKITENLRVFGGIQLISYITSAFQYIAVGVIVNLYLQRETWMFTYLIGPSVQNFSWTLENKNLFQILD